MRVRYLFFLLFLLAVNASAQSPVSPPAASNVAVIQSGWHFEVRNPVLENEDPFRANNEVRQAILDQKETLRQNEIRARSGLPAERAPDRRRPLRIIAGQSFSMYIYEAKIKNTGEKTIHKLDWDYVFLEPRTGQEVGRRRFVSEVKVRSGKTKNLFVRSASPPTGAINAKDAGKKARDQYSEQVVIQRIEYTDGSVWQAGTPIN